MTVVGEREALRTLVTELVPYDKREAADRAHVLDWIDSSGELYRQVPPDQPPQHLVTYFLPYDATTDQMFLVAHRNAGLWLPPGVHWANGVVEKHVVDFCRWRDRLAYGQRDGSACGTHAAGIIASRGNLLGIAPQAMILPRGGRRRHQRPATVPSSPAASTPPSRRRPASSSCPTPTRSSPRTCAASSARPLPPVRSSSRPRASASDAVDPSARCRRRVGRRDHRGGKLATSSLGPSLDLDLVAPGDKLPSPPSPAVSRPSPSTRSATRARRSPSTAPA
jgi:hypothetical protein